MTTSRVEASISKAVVDTSPLYAALLLELVRKSPPSQREAILRRSELHQHLQGDPIRQDAFYQLFASIRNILTTPHVVAEIQGLLKRHELREFWLHGMDLLKRRNMSERRVVSLLDMRETPELREAVFIVGPSDTGLIDLARRVGGTLLTDDERTLFPMALKMGVDCRLIKNVIP